VVYCADGDGSYPDRRCADWPVPTVTVGTAGAEG
jgi:hypothetical protein